jgi:NAD(P)-dependent dehydrogenase (short-subunit alcohol dehydrogenase family)
MKLEGKTVMVTGGCSGLGKAAVYSFAQRKCKILIVDFSVDAALELIEELRKSKVEVEFIETDITEED